MPAVVQFLSVIVSWLEPVLLGHDDFPAELVREGENCGFYTAGVKNMLVFLPHKVVFRPRHKVPDFLRQPGGDVRVNLLEAQEPRFLHVVRAGKAIEDIRFHRHEF